MHLKCWSVQENGIVIDHVPSILLGNCKFIVQPGGRERVREEKRKNVHAFVEGTRLPYEEINGIGVTYNPYRYESFVIRGSEEPIFVADKVFCREDGKLDVEI